MAQTTKNKRSGAKVEHYLEMDVTTEVEYDREDQIYIARIKGWKGCSAYGDTVEEAFAELEIAKKLWIEGSIESGYDIPESKSTNDYSGKFLVRVPKTIHKDAAEKAEEEGVSLNQLVLSILSRNL